MMQTIKVDKQFRITIPKEIHPLVEIGQEYIVSQDRAGRLILTPAARVKTILAHTAGLWQGRDDLPDTGIEYVDQMRSGNRLNALGIAKNGD